MSAVAVITTFDGKVTRKSTITVVENGVSVAQCPVTERGHGGGRGESARVLSSLVDLGWQTVGREDQLREWPDHTEIDVVRIGSAR